MPQTERIPTPALTFASFVAQLTGIARIAGLAGFAGFAGFAGLALSGCEDEPALDECAAQATPEVLLGQGVGGAFEPLEDGQVRATAGLVREQQDSGQDFAVSRPARKAA